MQVRSQRYAVLASVVLALALAACSSSTSPTPPITPAQLAAHFDSMYVAELANGTSTDTSIANFIAEYFELAPAYGGGEASFTATTGSGTETWHGVSYAVIESECMSTDTMYLFALYPNRNLQQAMYVVVDMSNGPQGGLAFGTNSMGATVYSDSVASGTASILSTGAACTLQSGLTADTLYNTYTSGFGCALAKFQTSFSVAFSASDNLGALSALAVSNATFAGTLFTQSGGSHVVAIPSKGAGLMETARALLDRRR